MPAAVFIMSAVLAAIGPLTDSQRGRLDTAFDGRDHQEEAFAALLEHVRTWTDGLGDAPLRLHPDPDAMIADPHMFRGDLCRITGHLQQSTPLEKPWGGVSEWFVRDAQGRPLLVYVIGGAGIDVATAVQIDARFYKRIDDVARDGTEHAYAAFVGGHVTRLRNDAGGTGSMLLVLGPVLAVMGAAFLGLVVLVRRQRGSPRRDAVRGGGPRGAVEVDDERALPDDPVEAMAELKRRGETEP